MDRSFFTSQMSLESQPVQAVANVIGKLTAMYNLLMFEMDRRTIIQANLDVLRKDIRDIIEEIVTSTIIKDSISSTDAAKEAISQVRTQLDLAADMLEKKNRQRFYACLNNTCTYLDITIKHLQNRKTT